MCRQPHRETKTILPDLNTGVDQHTITNMRM